MHFEKPDKCELLRLKSLNLYLKSSWLHADMMTYEECKVYDSVVIYRDLLFL